MDIRSSMRVNLIQHTMNTNISSPQISTDGHSIANLLLKSTNGFLVEHFIKPPVFIEVEFMCNMYVHEICINTRIGTQKSKGIEIIVNDSTVGKCYLTSEQDIVQWERHTSMEKIKDCTTNKNIAKYVFYNGSHKHLNSVRKITIKIFKTESSSLVSVKSMNIIGSINKKTNSPQAVQEFVGLLQVLYSSPMPGPLIIHESFSNKNILDNTTGNISIEDTSQNPSVPEDFLDPITHEFMTNPFILPCGKIIDKSTLDKYLEIELKWNRLPNDPFTHVKFNQHQKPMQALQLKSRIDKFLFLNKNNSSLSELPRTFQNLHGKRRNENLLFKILGTNQIGFNSTSIDKDEEIVKFKTWETNDSLGVKRRRLSSNFEIKKCNKSLAFENSEIQPKEAETGFSFPVRTSHGSNTSDNTGDILADRGNIIVDLTEDTSKAFESTSDQNDLNSRIQATLKHLPSFISEDSDTANNKSNNFQHKQCCHCKSDNLLYKIVKCSHHTCRSCLDTKERRCSVCKISFDTKDVIRIFNS